MVPHARRELGGQQPAGAFDEHVAAAIGRVDHHVHPARAPRQAAAVLQVHRVFGRVP
jgi:hypothetical protein